MLPFRDDMSYTCAMNSFLPGDLVACLRNELSVGGLALKDYVIESVSLAGYLWLLEPGHPSGRIGPYVESRFDCCRAVLPAQDAH